MNALVDEFQLYDRALSQEEITAPQTAPGAGNLVSYKFDEESGNAAIDSSPTARNATLSSLVFRNEGKVFKQRDQQNFSPFTEGVVPNTDNYKLTLQYYADKAEFPIMPSYTANQRDKADAEASGRGGSNNLCNINSTLQAQLYSKALRDYPSEYITLDMLRKLLEWVTLTECVNGDNRYPDNNEFFFNYNDETKTFGRSGIHHNILGAFNTMIFDDIVHYAVNNLTYHGADMTIVFDRVGDGKTYYPGVPEGMSLYIRGRRVLTVDDTAHVSWNSETGEGKILDGSTAGIRFSRAESLIDAPEVDLSTNARVSDMFQKAGVDLSSGASFLTNLAKGRPVSASFTTTSPNLQATAPEFAVDGFTISGLPIQTGGYIARNAIWGTQGSPNAQDWLEVDLGSSRPVDTVKLYFYSNKAFGAQGNTYREPSEYTIQYHDGSGWVDVPGQVRSPAAPAPNYNRVDFPDVMTQRLRVLVTRTGNFGVGIKELQAFHSGSVTPVPGGVGGTVPATLSLTLGPPASFGAFTPGVQQVYSASTTANVMLDGR